MENGLEISKTFDFVISCVGALHKPLVPKFTGAERFRGQTWHTAEWRSDISLKGK